MSNSLVPPLFPEQPDFQYIWKQSESYEPKKEQKIQSLSAAMDVDEDTVRQNLPDYEALFASQQLYNDTVARSYPTFYRNLSNTPFVAAARDDMGNLIETEGWWNEISNAYNVARDTVAIGNIGTRAMLEGRDLYPYERRKIEQARQRQRAHMQSEPGFLAAAAELAGTMQETLGYSLAAGATAGAVSGPAAPVVAPIAAGVTAFATSFNLEAGNLYADLIADGYTPAQAADVATKYGAAIAGFEAVGLKLAGQPIKQLGRELMKKQGRDLLRRETAGQITGRILRDYAVGIVGEATTEGIQEIISEFGKARASQIYRPENLYEPEYYETFTQAFTHTAKGMVVLGGVPSAVRLGLDNVRTANANHDYQKAKEAAEIRGRSKAREAQRQVDSEAGETTTLNSSYYVRAQDFKSAIAEAVEAGQVTEKQVRDTVEANSPGLMAKIDEAAERDGEVELTKTEFEDAFDNTTFREVAFSNVAYEEDGLTNREVRESEAIRDQMLKERGEKAEQELQDMDEFERQLRDVRQDVTRQLGEAMKGMDAEQTLSAAAYSSAIIGFIRRAALQQNITPQEFYQKHFPQIVQQRLGAGPVGPQALAAFAGEASNMTPEVQQLFRQAVQLSEEGKNAREIWQDTGWYVGPDGKPYYEINDQNAQVSLALANAPTGTRSNLRRVLNHPELFEAYPELESLEVEYVYGDVNRQGKAAGRLGTLTLSPDGSMQISLNENLRQDPDLLKSVLLHEVQHAIQVMERSKIQGGVSEKVTRTDLDAMLERDLNAIESSLSDSARAVRQDGKSIADMFRSIAKSLVYRSVPITQRKKLAASLQEIANTLSEADKTHVLESLDIMNDFYRVGSPDSKYRSLEDMIYQRLAGEAEARNAEARLSMTAEERRQSFPQDTADIPTSRLILAIGKSDESGAVGLLKPDIGADPVSESTAFLEGVTRPERFGLPPRETAPRPETLEAGEQRRKLGQAEVEGGNAIKKILLDPNAKPTTLMHELMHWNLELMATIGLDIEGKMAQEGYEATMLEAQMLGDIQRLLKWSGFEGTLTEWRAMSIDQRREFHEAIAVSFERYLYEGVAPSRELRSVFRRLVDYIRGAFEELVLGYQRDYEREFGRELPGLNDEVRAIFGRMMSAERDVQAFFDQSELDAMLMTREEWVKAGRDAQEYDEYEQEFKDSMYESKAELTQRRMDEVGTFTRAYELVARKQRAELNRIRKQIRQEVEAEVRLQPVYQLRSWIKGGTFQTETGPVTRKFYEEDGKTELSRSLDREMVEAINPELAKKLSNRRMLKKGGMPLDAVRNMFGFESNEAMLQALADSRNLADEIMHRTDQRLLNEHTDLMDPVVQQENIHAAVHNKIRQKVLARELKFLLNNGRSTKVEMKAMADAAEQIIENTPTGDIDIAAYSRAASRARKKGLKALKDGDMEAAKFAKRQELLNEALVREGLKVRAEVRRLVNTNKRVFKRRTDKAIAEAGYDVTIVKAARALLFRMGIGRSDFDPADALARFRQEDPEFYEEVRPQLEYFLGLDIAQPRVGDRRKPMEHLTPGDVRSLRGLAERMMKRAKDKLTAKIGERKENIDKLRQEAQATMESNVEVKRRPDDKSIFGKIRDYFSDIIRFEHLFRRIDGGKVGIWTQMFRQVKDAANMYRQELRQFLSKDPKTGEGFDFEGKLRSLDLKIPGGVRTLTMDLPSANRKVEIGADGRHAKTELIHLAMHYYGNSSNRKRLVEGYAGRDASEQTMQQVDVEIRRFLEQQVQQGILTRKDFEFMQSIFDHFNSEDMRGRAQQVMKNLRGYEMTEVKAEEFPIQFPGDAEATVFGGGYIPIRFKDAVQKEEGQGVLDEDMSLDQQASKMVNILPGFTKDRVKGEVGKELYLGLSQLASHAAEVYRFINMAEPVDSVSRVLQGEDLAAAFKARFGNKAYENLQGWMKRSAFQRLERGDQSEVGKMLMRLSRNANMSVMFLNIGNTLQNYAGLVIPMRRVGKRRIISALIHGAFNKRLAAEVAAKSPEMKARLERQIFDIYASQTKILTSEDSSWARLQQWSDKYAYVLQQVTQNHVDVAVWQAAYNQETEAALKENVTAEEAEARAIAHADSIVRQSQMAGEKEDISAFESGGPIYKALFPFKSWFINWLNNAATQGRLDLKVEDRSRAAAVASTYLYMLMIPAILAQAAVEVARGDDFDDDDDGYGDDMLELFARSQFEQVTGGLPFFSDVIRAGSNWYDDKYWNNRYPVAPWVRAIERIISAPVRKEPMEATLEVTTRMANLMGVPAVGVWDRVSLIGDEIFGELESEDTYDFFRAAVTGKRSDLQRLSQ